MLKLKDIKINILYISYNPLHNSQLILQFIHIHIHNAIVYSKDEKC